MAQPKEAIVFADKFQLYLSANKKRYGGWTPTMMKETYGKLGKAYGQLSEQGQLVTNNTEAYVNKIINFINTQQNRSACYIITFKAHAMAAVYDTIPWDGLKYKYMDPNCGEVGFHQYGQFRDFLKCFFQSTIFRGTYKVFSAHGDEIVVTRLRA